MRLRIATWLLAATFVLMGAGRGFAQGPDGDDPSALHRAMLEAYEAEDYEEAVAVGRRLVKLRPSDALAYYNLACVLTLAGETKEAHKALKRTAKLGYADLEQLDSDDDLAALRDHKDFKKVRQRVVRNHNARRQRFLEAVRASVPHVFAPRGYRGDEALPVVVALHDSGGDPNDFAFKYRKAASAVGALLVLPRSLYTADGGYQWRNRQDTELLVDRALDYVGELHDIDQDRIILSGFGQGGEMSLALALGSPDRYRGVIALATDCESAELPGDDVETSARSGRFYLMVGDEDEALASNRAAGDQLRAAGYDAYVEVYPGLGKGFPKDRESELKRAFEWVLR